MTKLFAASIIALIITSPALAQSVDPDCGTCNVVPFAQGQPAHDGGRIVAPRNGAHAYALDPRNRITSGTNPFGGGSPGYNEMLQSW